MKPSKIIQELAQLIYDKKGSNIIALDVRGVSLVTDFVLIADGNVERHVVALAKDIQGFLKKKGFKPIFLEGLGSGDWIVIDCIDLVVHLFIPKMRQKYQLERLWADGKIIELSQAMT